MKNTDTLLEDARALITSTKLKEALDPNDDADVWIDDFVKSDNPKFSGKSKEQRIKMALGAWYAAQKKESLDEEKTLKIVATADHGAIRKGETFITTVKTNNMGQTRLTIKPEDMPRMTMGPTLFLGKDGKPNGAGHWNRFAIVEASSDNSFYRLPGHVINNELFVAVRNLNTLQSSLRNGNDLDLKSLKSVIKNLNDIAKQAKSFKASDEIPVSYQYTVK
jgi:hypothetical protein